MVQLKIPDGTRARRLASSLRRRGQQQGSIVDGELERRDQLADRLRVRRGAGAPLQVSDAPRAQPRPFGEFLLRQAGRRTVAAEKLAEALVCTHPPRVPTIRAAIALSTAPARGTSCRASVQSSWLSSARRFGANLDSASCAVDQYFL